MTGPRIRNKRVKDLVMKAEKAGWTIQRGSKHLVLIPPDRSVPRLTLSTTENDGDRKFLNQRAELRKRGLDV